LGLLVRAMEPQKPITVEVLAYAPVVFFHCRHCEVVWQQTGTSRHFHQEQVASSLPEDLKGQYQQLSDWVREIIAVYGDRVALRVIDAVSMEGWFKSVRYGVHKYPAVVIDGKEKIIDGCFEGATALIDRKLASPLR
jgi:hypothetical protein